MKKQILTIGDTGKEKHKLHYHKWQILIDDVYIDKILISNKASIGL